VWIPSTDEILTVLFSLIRAILAGRVVAITVVVLTRSERNRRIRRHRGRSRQPLSYKDQRLVHADHVAAVSAPKHDLLVPNPQHAQASAPEAPAVAGDSPR
jgi:hypothetical protein